MAEIVEMAKYLLMLVLLMAVAWADPSSPAVAEKPVKAVAVAEPAEDKVEAEEPKPEEVKSDKPEEVEDKVEPTETEIEEYSERFLTFTTSTFTKFLTTSPVCTFSTSCATYAAAVTACRRRRGIDEEPQQVSDDAVKIEASQPVEVETTAAPIADKPSAPELDSSSPDDSQLVKVKGLSCNKERNFGTVTVLFTTTVTSSTTCQSSSTKTNTISFAGCYPPGFTTCAAASG